MKFSLDIIPIFSKSASKLVSLAIAIGIVVGIAGAFFLITLAWCTTTRDTHHWLIGFLPLTGAFIAWLYNRYGERSVKGNNLLLEEFHSPKQIIPLRMAPLVYVGTILTHLFGGSAGREGTAVQMGGAIADQFTRKLNLANHYRKTILLMGISAGFAAVFGTPVAGAVFALEVMVLSKINYRAIFPCLLTAFIATFVCNLFPVAHTHYLVKVVPPFEWHYIFYCSIVGISSGLAALLFTKCLKMFGKLFGKIAHPIARPAIGGSILALAVFCFGWYNYVGLGIPGIVSAFETPAPQTAFLLKLILTTFTLSAGFKGGEVTPLFFIGATLGNALAFFIPLPIALMAAMGFVAVFSGATNTPIACIIMGMELFGLSLFPYLAIACCVAYLVSGHPGIYSAQKRSYAKRLLYLKIRAKAKKHIAKRKSFNF